MPNIVNEKCGLSQKNMHLHLQTQLAAIRNEKNPGPEQPVIGATQSVNCQNDLDSQKQKFQNQLNVVRDFLLRVKASWSKTTETLRQSLQKKEEEKQSILLSMHQLYLEVNNKQEESNLLKDKVAAIFNKGYYPYWNLNELRT